MRKRILLAATVALIAAGSAVALAASSPPPPNPHVTAFESAAAKDNAALARDCADNGPLGPNGMATVVENELTVPSPDYAKVIRQLTIYNWIDPGMTAAAQQLAADYTPAGIKPVSDQPYPSAFQDFEDLCP